MNKFLPLLLIIFGEFLAIIAEMMGPSFHKKFSFQIFIAIELVLIIFGGFFLVYGYIKGLESYGNIWKVSVCSITTLLIFEPLLALFFYKQLPDMRAAIGFLLGAIGLIITLS